MLLVEFQPHEVGAGFWYLLASAIVAIGAGLCAFQSRWRKPLWILGMLVLIIAACGLCGHGLALSYSTSTVQMDKSASSTRGVYQVGVCVEANSAEYRIALHWQTDKNKDILGFVWNAFYLERFDDQFCGVIGPLEEDRVTTVTVTEPRDVPWVATRFNLRYLSGTPVTSVVRVYRALNDGKYHFRVIAASNLDDDIPTVDIMPVTDPAPLFPSKPTQQID